MWQQGYRNVGIVLQSYLRAERGRRGAHERAGRARAAGEGGVQGTARPSPIKRKADVDAAFIEIMQLLLDEGTYPAIATHDPEMIAATRAFAAARGIAPDRYEFQMLYGVRRDLQAQLRDAGYRVRIYIPFGREWFPYFMRRLGERPANVGFVIRALLQERRSN